MRFLKNKRLKALISLALVLLMVFAVPSFVFADDTPVSSDGNDEPTGTGEEMPGTGEDQDNPGEGSSDTGENLPSTGDGENGEIEMSEEEKKELALGLFNSSVNSLKTGKPKFYYSYTAGMLVSKKETGLLGLLGDILGGVGSLVGNFTGEPVEDIERLLTYLLVPGKTERNYINVGKGEENKNILPIKGEDYVSALSLEDEFTYSYKPFSYGGYEITIYLPDEINPEKDSALFKVFDIPEIDALYGLFYNVAPEVDWTKVQTKITNASLFCRVNQEGELSYYSTHYEASIAITDIAGLDLTNFTFPESMYMSDMIVQNIDWSPRLLGDGDGDGLILSKDARDCLRIAAKITSVSEVDFPYYDVNKDGRITAADARHILRAAAKLIDLQKEFGPVK